MNFPCQSKQKPLHSFPREPVLRLSPLKSFFDNECEAQCTFHGTLQSMKQGHLNMLISFRRTQKALTGWLCYIINPSNSRYMLSQNCPIQVSWTCNKPEKNITYHLLIMLPDVKNTASIDLHLLQVLLSSPSSAMILSGRDDVIRAKQHNC